MSEFLIESREGITFYKPDFDFLMPDIDVGTNCTLTPAEINTNFYRLEGRDIIGLTFDNNSNKLIITLVNGETFDVTLNCSGGGGGGGGDVPETIIYSSDNSIYVNKKGVNEYDLKTSGDIIPWQSRTITDISQAFRVTNPVGGYEMYDRIPPEEKIETILKIMLTNVTDVAKVLPYTKLSIYDLNYNPSVDLLANNPSKKIYTEAGLLRKFKIKLTYETPTFEQQGRYRADWLTPNPRYAKCPRLIDSYFKISGAHDENISVGSTTDEYIWDLPYGIHEGETKIISNVHYGDSLLTSNDIKKSDLETPSENIIHSSWCLDKGSIIATYNYYYGYAPIVASVNPNTGREEYEILFNCNTMDDMLRLDKGECNISDTTYISSMESNNERPTLILALPQEHNVILTTMNSLQANVADNWGVLGMVEYTPINNIGQRGNIVYYTIYCYFSMGKVKFTDIKFG